MTDDVDRHGTHRPGGTVGPPRTPGRTTPRRWAALAVAGMLLGGWSLADRYERPEPHDARSPERHAAMEGLGAGRVPPVSGDCGADQWSIERTRELFLESGLTADEQHALVALVRATRDCA